MFVIAMATALGTALPAASVEGTAQPSEQGAEHGAGFPVSGPVIWTTDDMLDGAQERVAEQEEPFYSAWLKTRAAADAALQRTYDPYHGPDYLTYFRTGKPHAQDVRSLAVAFHITGEERYANKARDILALWAADADPSVGSDSPHSVGLVLGRVLSMFADGYAMLWEKMTQAEREAVEDWFGMMVEPIMNAQRIWESGSIPPHIEPPWLDQQYFNNHLGAQNLGLAAIGFATDDQQLIRYALNSPHNPRDLQTLIDGAILMPDDIGSGEPGDLWQGDPTLTEGAPAPQPGEVYDRYRTISGTGMHYTHIHLRFLTLTAEMAHNNNQGRDYYDYVGPQGENFAVSYEFYSEFLVTGDASSRTGYYAGEPVDFNMLPLYELALRQYPESEEIREVLEARNRVAKDTETFGWTAVLTHGIDGVDSVDPGPGDGLGVTSWSFDTDGDMEGWTIRKAEAEVSSGALNIQVTGEDPGVVSPDSLGVDTEAYPYVKIRMKNTTQDTNAQLFFTTDENPTFSSAARVGLAVSAGDETFQEYVLDMSGTATWSGDLQQLRFDPVHGNSSGTVSIDSIELSSTP